MAKTKDRITDVVGECRKVARIALKAILRGEITQGSDEWTDFRNYHILVEVWGMPPQTANNLEPLDMIDIVEEYDPTGLLFNELDKQLEKAIQHLSTIIDTQDLF